MHTGSAPTGETAPTGLANAEPFTMPAPLDACALIKTDAEGYPIIPPLDDKATAKQLQRLLRGFVTLVWRHDTSRSAGTPPWGNMKTYPWHYFASSEYFPSAESIGMGEPTDLPKQEVLSLFAHWRRREASKSVPLRFRRECRENPSVLANADMTPLPFDADADPSNDGAGLPTQVAGSAPNAVHHPAETDPAQRRSPIAQVCSTCKYLCVT